MNRAEQINDRVCEFFRGTRGPNVEARRFVEDFSTKIPGAVIFGGMVRDLALGLSHSPKSDIDIVALASATELAHLIRKYDPSRNKFGGFRFAVGGQLFDLWSFDDTWAFRQGLVKAEGLDSLLETTFFNLDSAMFVMSRKTVSTRPSFMKDLTGRLLDINLEANPNPKNASIRAIRMAIEKRLLVAPKLGDFVLRHFRQEEAPVLARTYVRLLSKHLERTPDEPFRFERQKQTRQGARARGLKERWQALPTSSAQNI